MMISSTMFVTAPLVEMSAVERHFAPTPPIAGGSWSWKFHSAATGEQPKAKRNVMIAPEAMVTTIVMMHGMRKEGERFDSRRR